MQGNRLSAYCNCINNALSWVTVAVGASKFETTCMSVHSWTCVYVQRASLWCVCAAIPIVIEWVSSLFLLSSQVKLLFRPGEIYYFLRGWRWRHANFLVEISFVTKWAFDQSANRTFLKRDIIGLITNIFVICLCNT